jgi:hypothetical protein
VNGANVTSYVLERSDDNEPLVNGESVWRVVTSTANTSHLATELNPCHSSIYRIRAFTGTLYSDYSPTLASRNSTRCQNVLGRVSIGTPVSVPNGFTLQINDYDNINFEWKVLHQGYYAAISSSGLISDSQMTPGLTKRIIISKISRATGEYVGVTYIDVVAGS